KHSNHYNVVKGKRYESWYRNRGTSYYICKDCDTWLRKNRGILANKKLDISRRHCFGCNSSETVAGNWYLNPPTDYVLCSNCYLLIIKRDKLSDYKTRHSMLYYKVRTFCFLGEIRIGVCNLCRAVAPFDTKMTQRHHDNGIYFDDNPLKNTLELCLECHAMEGIRLGQLKQCIPKMLLKKEP